MTSATGHELIEQARPTRAAAAVGWLRGIVTGSLTRNGYSLIANVGISSGLGFFFWLLAARLFPTEVVGQNAALISVLMTICVIAQLNLGSVLTRFLPVLDGRTAAGWIGRAYGASAAATILAATVFIVAAHWFVPSLQYLTESGGFIIWFIVACVAWNILALQEGALAGLRSAIWIPVANTVAGVGKVALVVALAGMAFSAFGPFIAWTLPVAVTVVAVNFLIFSSLSRSQTRVPSAEAPGLSTISRYLGGDYLGQVLFSMTWSLSSVLVIQFAGAEANAVYYVALTMAYALYLASKSMAVSLVAEAAADERQLPELAVRALKHSLTVVVFGTLLLWVVAPFILNWYGPSYAAEGVMQLRLLALSAVPFVFTAVALGVARVQNRMAFVAAIQGAATVLVLAASVPLMQMFGASGMAMAWLAGHGIVAVVATALTAVRLRRQP